MSISLLQYIENDSIGSSYSKAIILHKRKVPDKPILRFLTVKFQPLIRVEEAVFVGDVEDLAKESRILCDCSKRVVADDKNR